MSPWFERVSSEEDPADGISRDEWIEAASAGWRRIPHPLSDPVYEVLSRVASAPFDQHSVLADELSAAVKNQVKVTPPAQ